MISGGKQWLITAVIKGQLIIAALEDPIDASGS